MNKWIKFKRGFCLSMAFMTATCTTAMASVAVPPTVAATQQVNTAGPGATTSTTPAATTATTTTVQTVALEKPVVQAQGAILYDVTHNQVLFEQNADMRFYPASITKLMTALLVLERCNLTDMVTFSAGATTNLESGAVTLKVKAGDKISVKDCLYGLLLKSANEIANGLAEHVSGSVSGFADLMNQKAASLGCTNTHFANPNGLNNANHYTTARDMALIAAAAFSNQTLSQIASTINYDFPATTSVPTVRKLTMGHKMLNPANTEYYYQGVVGGKTGYTSLAGNTLVTCVEQNGVRLISVILKSKQSHYQDTKALLDYGFAVTKNSSAAGNNTTAGNNTATGNAGPAGNTGNTGTTGVPGTNTGTTTGTTTGVPGTNTGTTTGTTTGVPGTAGTGPSVQGGTPAQTGTANTWAQDTKGWRYVKADGTYAKKQGMPINNEFYYFGEDEYMVTGWNYIENSWYFFRPSGGMARSRWVETNGMWYYVTENGSLLTNGTSPDGFKVDANGVWVK